MPTLRRIRKERTKSICQECGKEFERYRPKKHIFCSDACRNKSFRKARNDAFKKIFLVQYENKKLKEQMEQMEQLHRSNASANKVVAAPKPKTTRPRKPRSTP
jgi:DNA-directed RNA polymerase subunit RPC12/RpoP